MKYFHLIKLYFRNFLALIIVLCTFNSTCFAKFENLSIVVLSCDKYSSLWEGFFHQLYKQWPELKTSQSDIPIYLVSNDHLFDDDRITVIHTNKEESFSDNVLDALAQVKTDYVFILLDDYYLTRFDQDRFAEIYNYMVNNPVAYVQVSNYSASIQPIAEQVAGVTSLFHRTQHGAWRNSLQACLWKKANFQFLLKKGEDPWQFEVLGNDRSKGMMEDFLIVTDEPPLHYLNMVHLGHIDTKSLATAKKLNIPVDKLNFPNKDDHKIYYYVKKKADRFYKKLKRKSLQLALFSWAGFIIFIIIFRKRLFKKS